MLTIIRRAIGLAELDRSDSESEVVAFTAAALRSFDAAMLRRLSSRRTLTIALVDDDLDGLGSAAALFCDWLALQQGRQITLDANHGMVNTLTIAALFSRLPNAASRLLWFGPRTLDAETAVAWQIADAVIAEDETATDWLTRWLEARSPLALAAGGGLIRRRGGDPLERAEFARLFAAGEPKTGLDAFLGRRRPEFESATTIID